MPTGNTGFIFNVNVCLMKTRQFQNGNFEGNFSTYVTGVC